jgi:hypothetical protein
MEVVVAFDGQTAKVEVSGHAADTVVSFENYRAMAIPDQLVCHRQAHGAGAENGDALIVRHQKSSTTLL